MAKQKPTFQIIIIENGRQDIYECANKKEKNQWLYDLFTKEERKWAWEQWNNSNYKTFDKWFKSFTKPKWKGSDFQYLFVNKKFILIRKNIKKVGK